MSPVMSSDIKYLHDIVVKSSNLITSHCTGQAGQFYEWLNLTSYSFSITFNILEMSYKTRNRSNPVSLVKKRKLKMYIFNF